MCICRLTLAWISCETSSKLLGMPTYPDRSSTLLWTSSHPTGLSAVRCRLPFSSSFVQLPSRIPLPTSGHAESSSPKPFCLVLRQKTDKGIVCLADLLHSVTGMCLLFRNFEQFLHYCVLWYRPTDFITSASCWEERF